MRKFNACVDNTNALKTISRSICVSQSTSALPPKINCSSESPERALVVQISRVVEYLLCHGARSQQRSNIGRSQLLCQILK
mmetsp:Transcript_139189/g.246016  ORF Transcript_139189/g.246016 Transcript_139189/m.246016 type:complete len:81 (+) Transcript_139189:69-311(+)